MRVPWCACRGVPAVDVCRCMGIAHDSGASTMVSGMGVYSNVYWAFGGGHRQLVLNGGV